VLICSRTMSASADTKFEAALNNAAAKSACGSRCQNRAAAWSGHSSPHALCAVTHLASGGQQARKQQRIASCCSPGCCGSAKRGGRGDNQEISRISLWQILITAPGKVRRRKPRNFCRGTPRRRMQRSMSDRARCSFLRTRSTMTAVGASERLNVRTRRQVRRDTVALRFVRQPSTINLPGDVVIHHVRVRCEEGTAEQQLMSGPTWCAPCPGASRRRNTGDFILRAAPTETISHRARVRGVPTRSLFLIQACCLLYLHLFVAASGGLALRLRCDGTLLTQLRISPI
jgi:hypothetical protein